MTNNRSRNSSLSMKDLEEISMMVTQTKLLAMKLMTAHNLNPSRPTAPDDGNYSIRLQKFSQTLQEIGKFYESN